MKRWLTASAVHAAHAPTTAGPGRHAARTGPAAPNSTAVIELTTWLARLRLLHGVPFHYLVPDARMLPAESIRFFQVDPNWLTALLDGAFSVGRAASAGAADQPALRGTGPDAEADRGADLLARAVQHAPQIRAGHLGKLGLPLLRQARTEPVPPAMSGFLLRSGVVSGWPSLEILAQDAAGSALTILRLERLAEDVLLALFAGVVSSVVFREPAEALHFGVEPAAPGQSLRKKLRYLDGAGHKAGEPLPEAAVNVPLRNPALGVVDVAGLQTAVRTELLAHKALSPHAPYAAGHFALEMVQGVQRVEFTVKPAAPTL